MLRPALATQYSPRVTLANRLEIDVMNTICGSGTIPADCIWSIARATDCERKKGPRRFVSSTRSQLSGVVSSRSSRRSGAIPALLTQRSTRPATAIAFSRRRRPSAGSATSARIGRQRGEPRCTASPQVSAAEAASAR